MTMRMTATVLASAAGLAMLAAAPGGALAGEAGSKAQVAHGRYLVIGGTSEAQWVAHARQERLPPMPWFNLRAMSDQDLKDIYAYVRSLGRAGTPVPAYVAPGGRVDTPYFVFVPQVDQKHAAH